MMRLFAIVGLLGLLIVGAGNAWAAPKAELWDFWAAHDDKSKHKVDHKAWDKLLAAFVRPGANGVARFAYGEVGADEKGALQAYVDGLTAEVVTKLTRAEQRAYWINLYNALTVKVILDHYPVKSIRDIDITPGLFADGPWGAKLLTIEGQAVSLDDIEHRILRPIWKDPRIHYAVNCASMGCPDLQAKAFTAKNTEKLLDQAAKDYINHPRGATVIGDDLVVSSIYHWFADDFGGTPQGVLAHLIEFADPGKRAMLETFKDIGGHDYDWSLNDVGPPPQSN